MGVRFAMIVRAQLRVLFVGLVCAFVVRSAPTQADALRATAGDRAVVEACLKLVNENAEKEAQGKSENESLGAAGRLAAAAKDAATQRESCIGAVNIPCQQEPGGASTMGTIDCITREWMRRWDRSGQFGCSPDKARQLRRTCMPCHRGTVDQRGFRKPSGYCRTEDSISFLLYHHNSESVLKRRHSSVGKSTGLFTFEHPPD